MNDLNLSRRAKEIWLILAAFGVLMSPLYAVAIIMIGVLLVRKLNSKTLLSWILAGGAAVAGMCALVLTDTWGSVIPETRAQWLLGLSSPRLAMMLLCLFGASLAQGGTADEQMLTREAQRRREKYVHTQKMPLDSRGHMAVLGTTGSGKTTALLHLVRDSIARGEQLYVVSGKNGSNDARSLLNMTKALAAEYNRPVYVVSVNPQEDGRRRYNPLEHMLPVELADAMLAMSEYTEPHYREATGLWIKTIAELLWRMERPLSLQAIMDVYQFDAFSKLAKEAMTKGIINKEQLRAYLGLRDIAEEASLSRSRYMNLLYGEGREIFGGAEEDYVNCYRARQDNAIFILDLDSFRYSDFTMALGRLCINDLRNLISTESDIYARRRIILDELGSFATEQLMPIFSQARSYGYQIVVATQSIADLDEVSETYSKRLLENCNQYMVLRLNEAQDAERIANLIGTETVVETTRKSEGNDLALGGEGTKRLVQEYRVPPDTIKTLAPLTAVYYDKERPDTVQMIHIPFVET